MSILGKIFPGKQPAVDVHTKVQELEAKVDKLGSRVTNLEHEIGRIAASVDRDASQFRDFKHKTSDELHRMLGQNEQLRRICESLINAASANHDKERAQAILKKLKTHKTLMDKALATAKSAGIE